MEILEKYIDASPYKKIFVKGISELTETQKSELEDLVIRLEKAGAKNPFAMGI